MTADPVRPPPRGQPPMTPLPPRPASPARRRAFACTAALLTTAAAAGARAAQTPAAAPRRLLVGPRRALRTLAEAARQARGPTLIEVDAGDHHGDVAVFQQADVALRAVGGRVRLHADGAAAEGKAIWVVRQSRLEVQGFDFLGTRVAAGNGAGIRFESGALAVRGCRFDDNQNGILTGNDSAAELTIEDSEFGHNGDGDGYSHNLYVGTIARLHVSGCWLHHARRGHLLKSRAACSDIAYNRLADGDGGSASYELEFPSGGVARVVGNFIQQSAQTDNPRMIAYGAEGWRWPRNALYLVNNTLLDERPAGGEPLHVWPGGDVGGRACNNLLIGGSGAFVPPGNAADNHRAEPADFVVDADGAWRLAAGSRWQRRAVEPGVVDGVSLRPLCEYRHPASSVALADRGGPLQPGAWQLPAGRP